MKYFNVLSRILSVLWLLVAVTGCATQSSGPSKQSLLIGAGFKIITPSTPKQRALLTSLPPDKVSPVMYNGKKYYVMPDVANNQAYAGSSQQYQAYRVSRADQNLSNEDLEAAQWNEMSNLGDWSGWTATGFGE